MAANRIVLFERRLQEEREGFTRLENLTPTDNQCQYSAVDSVGGRTKVEVREVQKPRAAVGSGSSNALLGADTPRGSM